MIFKLNRISTALMIFSCVAAFIGCTSSSSQPGERANLKPTATVETKTTETINKGSGDIETKTVSKTTVEETTDGKPPKTTYEGTSSLNTSSSSGDKIGVPECDEYIEKYEACIRGKVPEAARGAMESSIEQMRKSWKDVAANPQAKKALAGGCKQAQETAKQTMSAYNCAW